jgi:hypothetical protein
MLSYLEVDNHNHFTGVASVHKLLCHLRIIINNYKHYLNECRVQRVNYVSSNALAGFEDDNKPSDSMKAENLLTDSAYY